MCIRDRPIALLGDGSVIPGKVALAVQRQPAHAAGTGIFQIGIEEIGCLADAGSADHEAVDIVAVHQSGKLALLALAPQHQPLLRGAVVAAAPVPDPERDMGIDLFDLLCGGDVYKRQCQCSPFSFLLSAIATSWLLSNHGIHRDIFCILRIGHRLLHGHPS